MYYHLTRINIENEENQSMNVNEYQRYVSYSEATRAENDMIDITNEIKYRHIFLSII